MRYPMDSSDPPTGRWPRITAATNWPLPAASSLNGWVRISSPNCQTRLALHLPRALLNESDFTSVASAIEHIGGFLQQQGYLRSHFAFRFDVTTTRAGRAIVQKPGDVIQALGNGGTAYALYEMGHPVILPSAVYLYRTVGEAQHHSSRTIEELFARVGCDAWETDDFDPTNYPSDLVVELWQIRRRPLID